MQKRTGVSANASKSEGKTKARTPAARTAHTLAAIANSVSLENTRSSFDALSARGMSLASKAFMSFSTRRASEGSRVPVSGLRIPISDSPWELESRIHPRRQETLRTSVSRIGWPSISKPSLATDIQEVRARANRPAGSCSVATITRHEKSRRVAGVDRCMFSRKPLVVLTRATLQAFPSADRHVPEALTRYSTSRYDPRYWPGDNTDNRNSPDQPSGD